jgi:hypothetical protein
MPDREELLLITGTTGDPTVRLLLDRGHRVRALVLGQSVRTVLIVGSAP